MAAGPRLRSQSLSGSGARIEDLDLGKTGPEATIEALLSVTAYFRISHQRAFSHHQKTQIPSGPETAGNLTPLPEGSQHVSF